MCLGRDSELDAAKVVQALKSLTRRKRETLGRRGRSSVDGLGIERIRRVIESEALRTESA